MISAPEAPSFPSVSALLPAGIAGVPSPVIAGLLIVRRFLREATTS